MKNLKFAIVDSSESFALKIQESLESKAGENSETVIITDRNYLEEFFSEDTPHLFRSRGAEFASTKQVILTGIREHIQINHHLY